MNWERISGWCWTTAMVSAVLWLLGLPTGAICIAATLATIPLPFPKWKSFDDSAR